jgi:hypothetical protein
MFAWTASACASLEGTRSTSARSVSRIEIAPQRSPRVHAQCSEHAGFVEHRGIADPGREAQHLVAVQDQDVDLDQLVAAIGQLHDRAAAGPFPALAPADVVEDRGHGFWSRHGCGPV